MLVHGALGSDATSLLKSVGSSSGIWGCRESRNPEGKFGQAENLSMFLKQGRYKNIRFISILEIELEWK